MGESEGEWGRGGGREGGERWEGKGREKRGYKRGWISNTKKREDQDRLAMRKSMQRPTLLGASTCSGTTTALPTLLALR